MAGRIQPKQRVNKKTVAKLTAQQQLFVLELSNSEKYNLTEAAKNAGYLSPATAGSKLLQNPSILAAVGKAFQDRIWRLELSSDRVLKELQAIAFFNPKEMLDANGDIMELKDMPEHVARAIQSHKGKVITTKEGSIAYFDIKFQDKLKALELIMRHMGMLDERLKVDHEVTDGTKDLISRILAMQETKPSNIVDASFIISKADEG